MDAKRENSLNEVIIMTLLITKRWKIMLLTTQVLYVTILQ